MGYNYWNGTEAAHRRVMMKAAGYSDEDIRQKPHIGIPNSYMAGSPGTAHLRQVTEAVKEGIWAAGGIPVEFGIPATCGNVANGADEMKYEQVGRDIVAMSIEFVSRIHNFDAICCVASCDLIIAGCYLAACRLDIPALVVTGGSMQAGNYCGKTVVEADLDAARFSGASEAELFEMEDENGQTIKVPGKTYTRKMTYVDIPFLAHLAFGRERGLQFFVHAGPQIGFLIGESETIEGIDMNTLSNTQKAIYGVKIQNKFDYGITGGGGVELRTKKAGSFLVEGRYYFALSDFYCTTKKDYFARAAHGTITVKLTYLFDLKK